jgi:hypothetical protein
MPASLGIRGVDQRLGLLAVVLVAGRRVRRRVASDRRDAGQPGRDGRLRERHGGHVPAPEFFGPENTGRIMQRAAA